MVKRHKEQKCIWLLLNKVSQLICFTFIFIYYFFCRYAFLNILNRSGMTRRRNRLCQLHKLVDLRGMRGFETLYMFPNDSGSRTC